MRLPVVARRIGAHAFRRDVTDGECVGEIAFCVYEPQHAGQDPSGCPSFPLVIAYEGGLYHFYSAVSGKYPTEVRGIAVARSQPW
jgi:hypothetical protein